MLHPNVTPKPHLFSNLTPILMLFCEKRHQMPKPMFFLSNCMYFFLPFTIFFFLGKRCLCLLGGSEFFFKFWLTPNFGPIFFPKAAFAYGTKGNYIFSTKCRTTFKQFWSRQMVPLGKKWGQTWPKTKKSPFSTVNI